MSFAEIADQLSLTSAKAALGELQWDVEPDPYQAEAIPETTPLEPLLQMMARRGLDPAAVACLFNSFPDRPLERALLAWDVARGSLLGSDGDLAQRVTRELAPLKKLSAQAPVAFPRDRVAVLVDAARPAPESESLLNDFATLPSLAALVQLTEVRKTLDDQSAIAEAVLAHVRLLEMAHLPSLAIAFLQILWDRFSLPQALDLLIEVALDHGMIELIPPLDGQDDRSIQRRTYLLVRGSLDDYNVTEAARQLDAVSSKPAIANSKDAALALARCELALMQNTQLGPQTLAFLDAMPPTWRYAARVKCASNLLANADDPVPWVDSFIGTFGNNARVWGYAGLNDDQHAALRTLISRELRYCSHDPEAWRAAALLVSDGEDIETAVEMRLAAQMMKALAPA